MYTVPLSAINGLSRLTTTSHGQARPFRKFSNLLITFESNWNGRPYYVSGHGGKSRGKRI